MNVILHCFLIFCANNFANSQVQGEGWRCETPNGYFGRCINVKQCQPLLQVLQAEGLTQQNVLYLRRSACGYNGRDPLVCCPQYRDNNNNGNNDDNNNYNNINRYTPSSESTSSTPSPLPTISVPTPNPTNLQTLATTTTSTHDSLYQLPISPACGFSNISSTRIVGGVPALLGQFPWMVVLGYKNPNNPNQPKWLCGGSMITDKHILTAAHCAFNRPDLYLARVGDIDLYSEDDGANPTTVLLANAKIHEEYNARKHINDIAILTMMHPHNNPSVWPICLPAEPSIRSLNFARTYPFIAGWGVIERNGPNSPTLQTALIPVVTNEECQAAYSNFSGAIIDKKTLCAGYTFGGKDTCQGDSGGPLMYSRKIVGSKNFEFFQIGIVSYGHECALAGYPGVYTRVTEFLDWIQNNLN